MDSGDGNRHKEDKWGKYYNRGICIFWLQFSTLLWNKPKSLLLKNAWTDSHNITDI